MRKIDLSDQALGELISKSEAATPGPWLLSGSGTTWTIMRKGNDGTHLVAQLDTDEDTAAFIAACDPETVREITRHLGITRWELRVCKTTIADLEAKVARLERKAARVPPYLSGGGDRNV